MNTTLLLLLLIAAMALTVTAVARGRLGNSKRQKSREMSDQLPVEVQLNAEASVVAAQGTLEGSEYVTRFEGWGIQGGFVRPSIREDLPLIWEINVPLGVEICQGATLSGSTGAIVSGMLPGRYTVAFTNLCNYLMGEVEGRKDCKWVRAVVYQQDVVKQFRVNMPNLDQTASQLTVREVAREMIALQGKVKDSSALSHMIRVFERAFYGRKNIERAEFEEFLLGVKMALPEPKAVVCGPKGV